MEQVKDIFLSNLEKKLLYGGKATQKLEEKQQESEMGQIHLGDLTREQKLIILEEFNKSKYVSFTPKRPNTERNDRFLKGSQFHKPKESVTTPRIATMSSSQNQETTLLTEKQPTPQTRFSKVIQEHNFKDASISEYQIALQKKSIQKPNQTDGFKTLPRDMLSANKNKFSNTQDNFDWKVQELINKNLQEMNEKLKGKTIKQISNSNLEVLKNAHAKKQEQFYQRVFMPTDMSSVRSSPSYLKYFQKHTKAKQSVSSVKYSVQQKLKSHCKLHKPRTKSIFQQ